MLYKDHQADIINRILDASPGPEDWAALNALLDASPDDALLWDGVRDVDRMLRQAPMLAPSSGFVVRVMERVEAEAVVNNQEDDSVSLVMTMRLVVLTLVGVVVMSLLRFAFTRFFGPLPTLDEVLAHIGHLIGSIIDVIKLISGFIARFPMLPAIGLAAVPLAFATTWLVVYYTPRDQLRRVAVRYLTA